MNNAGVYYTAARARVTMSWDAAHRASDWRAACAGWALCCTNTCALLIAFVILLASRGTPGACCQRDGCLMLSEAACLAVPDSVFYDDNSTCADHACGITCCCTSRAEGLEQPCAQESMTYAECRTEHATCGDGGAGVAMYDIGMDCAENPCNASCCCTPFGPSYQDIATCHEFGGVALEYALCEPDSCAGGCCVDGACELTTSEFACTERSGYFLGTTIACTGAPDECPVPVYGACCITSFGTNVCLEHLTADTCTLIETVPGVDSTAYAANSTCLEANDMCPLQTNTGPCCCAMILADDSCTDDIDESLCTGAAYGGMVVANATCGGDGQCTP